MERNEWAAILCYGKWDSDLFDVINELSAVLSEFLETSFFSYIFW